MTHSEACTPFSRPSIKFKSCINFSFMSALLGAGCVGTPSIDQGRAGAFLNNLVVSHD